MATLAAPTVRPEDYGAVAAGPLLEPGDRLSRAEFERRYHRMPLLKKGRIDRRNRLYALPSPCENPRRTSHPPCRLAAYVCIGNSGGGVLRQRFCSESGGQARISEDDYIEGAPEFVVEIVGSSQAYDLHQKKGAYRRNGVREYLAWITGEKRLLWWELREEEYQEIPPDADGLLKSRIVPGLWLDSRALLRGDMKGVLGAVHRGLQSPEHVAFNAR